MVGATAIGFCISDFVFNAFTHVKNNSEFVAVEPSVPPETQAFFDSSPSFPEISEYLGGVADQKGAVYALDLLIDGALPPGIDTHLLGHFVARKLYKEQGIEGLQYCTDDLGYACAHAIVIEALFERGMEVFEDINAICEKAPGPLGAYGMCFHGFGHGVLAYTEYELPEAIKLCGMTDTGKYNYTEAVECAGGVVMEMRGGIHDPELWEKNGKKYLNEKKPIDMCLSDFMTEKYRYICLLYITPFLFDSIGAQDIPTWEEYKQAINLCDQLPSSAYRTPCYGGFGKEFVSFVYGRDVRHIKYATDEDLRTTAEACYLAQAEDGKHSCIEHTVYSLTRTGMYEYPLAGRYCSLVSPEYKDLCFSTFLTIMEEYYIDRTTAKAEVCSFIEQHHRQMCER
jgi:hypothetical protein